MDFNKDFLGYNFLWFIGEVEDRNDPLLLGRVRVRCFGWHTTDKKILPTSALPWASTIQPVNFPAASATGLTLGVWVFGFFMDGQRAQRPMIMGHIPGYRTGSPSQSELPPAARAEESYPSPYGGVRTENLKKDVAIDKDKSNLWDEPEEPDDLTYPETMTISHESGFSQQLTKAGRHTLYSPSGSYTEMAANGDNIVKVVGDGYRIIVGSDFISVAGNVNLTVEGNVNWNISGDWNMYVAGNVNQNIGGNITQEVDGNVEETFGGYQTTNASGNITIDAPRIDIG